MAKRKSKDDKNNNSSNGQWWQTTTIYQIYPRSFYDSNGDGIGDLQGIIQKLEYIKDLGFETIWLSPHYQSPQRDFGYDISDYYNIAPEYGTAGDALQLIKEVHRRGMKIIFDMILNHTSDEHAWFQESRQSRDSKKRDWYIWRDGQGQNKPPNNWAAIPGGSGWKYDEGTGQYFFHNFLDFQPDLNFRNPAVKKAMFDVMRYWLDQGVDGYRLDIFHAIFKAADFADNPKSKRYVPTADMDEGYFQVLKNNLNQPENFALAKDVRRMLDSYKPSRFVIGEVFGRGVVKKYLGEAKKGKLDGLNLLLLFDLVHLTKPTAENIRNIIEYNETEYAAPYIPTYAFGNHDRRRYFSRIGKNENAAKLLAVLLYTARGVAITYYGDELALPDGDFAHRKALDSAAKPFWWLPRFISNALGVYINRDGCRTPMQWTGGPHAGFTAAAKAWLPVHKTYKRCNVESQSSNPDSTLNIHRELLRLRNNTAALRQGSLRLHYGGRLPKDVVAYTRTVAGSSVLVVMNYSRCPQTWPWIFGVKTKALFQIGTGSGIGENDIKLAGWGALIIEVQSE